ncbi:MAG TPA: fatty acyl-AMP ligase [Candidatus Binatia bacterium]|nr:fatty acyl-AMP ligase [Candidatus Binatia bacterium]
MSDVRCPEYPPDVESLLGVLAWQREHVPERVVCHRVARRRDGLVATAVTVAELADRASRAATHLAALGMRPGDRAILCLSDPHDFLVAFFASLAGGAIPVPLPTAGEVGAPRSFAARVRGTCASSGARLAIVEGVRAFAEVVSDLPSAPVATAPGALVDPATPTPLVDRSGADPAFIQYTSGSTGAPKGVLVTNRNLLANCRAIRDATGYTRRDRMVSWLPLHHDMGLVGGLLTSIYCAAETWVMPPMEFLARPVTWLEALTRYAATLTVAPTFAYSLCARKIPAKQLASIDLSSLRLAYIGAEPIGAATVDAFIERFSPLGLSPSALYPVYGLAEATLAAAFPAPGSGVRRDTVDRHRLAAEGTAAVTAPDDPGSVTFVSVGGALPGHRLLVVDPATGEALVDRRVGELVVEGDSVSPRYFEDDPATTRTLLHTGDLAYVADGQVYVVDRIKDLVIVAGQNFAPSDIEAAAAEVDGLRRGRIVAFSRPGEAGREALHIVGEVSPDTDGAPDVLAAEVASRVRAATGLTPATVTLVAPGSLERTSSGKIQRRACAEAHAAGRLDVVRTPSELRARLRERRRAQWLHRGGSAAREVLDWLAGRVR